MAIKTVSIGALTLENGGTLPEVELAYEQCGRKDAPVILVCHALTGHQHSVGSYEEKGWWAGLIGNGKYINTKQWQVITFNVLGGCNGSTGPLSFNPETLESYKNSFPTITIRDIVRAQRKALDQLGVGTLKAVIGGSLGGMQVLEWGLLYPDDMEHLFLLAATPVFSDYGIAFNHIGIAAIENDPTWENGFYKSSSDVKGFEVARMAGMVTYRSQLLFNDRFLRRKQDPSDLHSIFEIQSYLNYQGKKLAKRFDVNSYLTLLKAMNSHDIGRNRGGWQQATSKYKAKLTAIAFEKDLIYTPEQMMEFVEFVPNGDYYFIQTHFGHDGFLVEFKKFGEIIQKKLESKVITPAGRVSS